MFKNFQKDKRGFSLVELIVVITMVAILSAILVPFMLTYLEEARAQRDDSAMGEVANAVRLAMVNQEVYDEILTYSTYGNFSCYIDKQTSKDLINDVIITRQPKGNLIEQYMFGDIHRIKNESIWYVAGNMRGVTLTFEPKIVDGKPSMVLADAILNKYVYDRSHDFKNSSEWVSDRSEWVDDISYISAEPNYEEKGTLSTMSGDAFFFHHLKSIFGPNIRLNSYTYRHSEYTVFIRMGSTGGNSGIDQDAIVVYGQWNGMGLSPN